MAVTVAGVSTTATWPGSTGLPFTINWPGAASGQLVILPVFARAAGTTIATTSTYTLKSTNDATGTNVTGEIQAKAAGGSETAPSVTSGILDTQPTGAIAIVIDGWSGDLSDVVVTQDIGASSNPICPAGTAPTDGCLVLRGVFVSDDNTASGPGLTQIFNEETGQGSDASMAWFTETANTGAVASQALPLTEGSDGWQSFTIVIAPATGGGGDDVTGSASAAFTFDAPAVGRRIAKGSAAAATTFDAPAVGKRTVKGSGVAAFTFDAAAGGASEGNASGTATAVFTFNATAVAKRTVRGSTAAAFLFNASASDGGAHSERAAITATVTARRTAESTATAHHADTATVGAANTQTSEVS